MELFTSNEEEDGGYEKFLCDTCSKEEFEENEGHCHTYVEEDGMIVGGLV